MFILYMQLISKCVGIIYMQLISKCVGILYMQLISIYMYVGILYVLIGVVNSSVVRF